MKVAASRSCAVARIALPNRVPNTNRSSASMRPTDTRKRITPVSGVSTLPRWTTACETIALFGTRTGAGLIQTWTRLSRKSETPIAVIRGASRLAFRSGR